MSARLGVLAMRHRDRVREILDATAVFRREEIGVALEVFDEAVRPGGSGDYEMVGAYDERDTLTGYACYGPTPATDRTFDLYWIAVHPQRQGSGEGTLLLDEVERRLRGRDARLLVVETSSRREYDQTRGFYEARGYIEAARTRDFYAPADDRVIYTKRLAPYHHQTARGVPR